MLVIMCTWYENKPSRTVGVTERTMCEERKDVRTRTDGQSEINSNPSPPTPKRPPTPHTSHPHPARTHTHIHTHTLPPPRSTHTHKHTHQEENNIVVQGFNNWRLHPSTCRIWWWRVLQYLTDNYTSYQPRHISCYDGKSITMVWSGTYRLFVYGWW